MPVCKPLPSREELLELFEDSGNSVRWRERRSSSIKPGSEVTRRINGYYTVHLGDSYFLVHRILFKMRTGEEPSHIDHIDGNKLNNRQDNLRAATKAQNGWNRPIQKNSSSGVKNVTKCPRTGKWVVRIIANGVRHNGGRFDDIYQAEIAACQLRNKLHGEFAHD